MLMAASQLRMAQADMANGNKGGGFYWQPVCVHTYFHIGAGASSTGVDLQQEVIKFQPFSFRPLPGHPETNARLSVMTKILSMKRASDGPAITLLRLRPGQGLPPQSTAVDCLLNTMHPDLTYKQTHHHRLTPYRLSTVLTSHVLEQGRTDALNAMLRHGQQVPSLIMEATCRVHTAVDWDFAAHTASSDESTEHLPKITREATEYADRFWKSLSLMPAREVSYFRGLPSGLGDICAHRFPRFTPLLLQTLAFLRLQEIKEAEQTHQLYVPLVPVAQYRLSADHCAWDVSALLATKYFNVTKKIGGIPHVSTKLLHAYLCGVAPYFGHINIAYRGTSGSGKSTTSIAPLSLLVGIDEAEQSSKSRLSHHTGEATDSHGVSIHEEWHFPTTAGGKMADVNAQNANQVKNMLYNDGYLVHKRTSEALSRRGLKTFKSIDVVTDTRVTRMMLTNQVSVYLDCCASV